ncbi:MAG TPA: hypothetical protein DCZ63_05875 [Geobacter sp.]|nr:hypothetical protein [Geobacter sp.]
MGWGIVLVLLMFHDSYAQIRDLVGTRYAVRALLAEPATTYLADSTLNKMVNIAHRMTLRELGDRTIVGVDSIVTTPGLTRYAPNSDFARITGVVRRSTTATGGMDFALAYIDPEQLGRLGVGPYPEHYYQSGRFLVLGQSPQGGDTLVVYYVPYARNLDTDTTQLQVAPEDHQTVVFLAAALATARDYNQVMAQVWLNLWTVGVRKETAPAAGQP